METTFEVDCPVSKIYCSYCGQELKLYIIRWTDGHEPISMGYQTCSCQLTKIQQGVQGEPVEYSFPQETAVIKHITINGQG